MPEVMPEVIMIPEVMHEAIEKVMLEGSARRAAAYLQHSSLAKKLGKAAALSKQYYSSEGVLLWSDMDPPRPELLFG